MKTSLAYVFYLFLRYLLKSNRKHSQNLIILRCLDY